VNRETFVNAGRIGTAVVLTALLSISLADRSAAAEGQPDVARLTYIAGSAFVQRGDSADSLDAVVNAPLVDGDIVTTGANGAAELHLSRSSHVRLAANTSVRLANLESDPGEMQIAQGTVEVRVLRSGDRSMQLDTPSISVEPASNSAVRVTVLDDGSSKIDVRSGNAELLAPQGNRTMSAGTAMGVSGTADAPVVSSLASAAADSFDAFNTARDDIALHAIEQQPQDNTLDVDGIDDLPSYGHWADTSDGDAWVPNAQSPDWQPYGDGRWVWEADFGYTWIGAEPWGWAPYHYGRWALEPRIGWAWFPGARAPWSPALVAFVSGPYGTELSLAWFPLGPGEAYHPWWGFGVQLGVVSSTNVTIVNAYRNAGVPGAVHGISYSGFEAGHFTSVRRFPVASLRDFSVVRGVLPIAPTPSLLSYGGRGLAVPAHPTFARTAFAGHPYSPSRPPFAQSREAIDSALHRPPVLEHSSPTSSAVTHSAFGPGATQSAPVIPHSAFGPGAVQSVPVMPHSAFGPATPTSTQQRPPSAYGATFSRPAPRSNGGAGYTYGSTQHSVSTGGAVYHPSQRTTYGGTGPSHPSTTRQQPGYRTTGPTQARVTSTTRPATATHVAPPTIQHR
jgi:hypothetical protein